MESNSNNETKYAREMKAWLMIQVIGQTSVNFLNIKRLKGEMAEHFAVLMDPGDFWTSEEKLKDFSEYFIDSCLHSKAYTTAVFGIMSMSESGAATRLAQDIIEVTKKIPARFGLEEESRTVHNVFLETYKTKIPGAMSILAELGHTMGGE